MHIRQKTTWLNQPAPPVDQTGGSMSKPKLHAVPAPCPNRGECLKRTATFVILGNICSRNCRFCAVNKGRPEPLDLQEPERVVSAVKNLKLNHVVLVSASRDDLPDGGAGLFTACMDQLRVQSPQTTQEVVVPDFAGSREALYSVTSMRPDLLNHNIETVPRLFSKIRPEADYRRSLKVLSDAAQSTTCKSGLMLGMGETRNEVIEVLRDLLDSGVAAVTIGQYLQPSARHLPVVEYVPPEAYEELELIGREMGFA